VHYEIEVGGRTRRVTVTPTGVGFAVAVDGQTRHVDVARIDANTLSLILDSAASKDAVIAPDPATGQLTVIVGGTSVGVALNGRRRRRNAVGADGGAGSGRPQRLTAPMPGKIVRVLVGAGQAVRTRQPLVVVEAMKMENELRAGRDGTVAEIHAREGQSVDAGALLVVIQ
jgi:biotin carboxyl carrier protein